MRNYILEAIIMMMIILFIVIEPVSAAITIQDNNEVECSSSYCSSEVKTAESIPVVAPLLTAAIKPKKVKKKKTKGKRSLMLTVGSGLSWAEYWSIPHNVSNYRFNWASAEKRASHFKGLIRTCGKKHVRRQLKLKAIRANRRLVKKRRVVRAKRGDIKTSEGWRNRKSFWTSHVNREIRKELKSQKLPCDLKSVILSRALIKEVEKGYTSDERIGIEYVNPSIPYNQRTVVPQKEMKLKQKQVIETKKPEKSAETAEIQKENQRISKRNAKKVAKFLKTGALATMLFLASLSDVDVAQQAGMITVPLWEWLKGELKEPLNDWFTVKEVVEKATETVSWKKAEEIEVNNGEKANKQLKRVYKNALKVLEKKDEVPDKNVVDAYVHLLERNPEIGNMEIEVEEKLSFTQKVEEIIENPDNAVKTDLLQEVIDTCETEDHCIELAESLWAVDKEKRYGKSKWKNAEELLKSEGDTLNAMKLALLHASLDLFSYKPEVANPIFARKGAKEQSKIRTQIKSSLKADYCLTIKVYPSNDKTLLADGKGHGGIPKLAVTADIQWMSGYSSLIGQYNSWCNEVRMPQDNPERLNVKFGDVIFVQNLKDSQGRSNDITTLNKAIMSLGDGYDAVTPGFWVRRGHKFGDWVRKVFGDNEQVRARGTSMATTPSQYGLEVDADGRSTLVMVTDLSRNGQPGADGANIVSYNYRLKWNGWVGQLRLHTSIVGAHKKGLQLKGLIRKHEVHVVKVGDKWEIRWDYKEKKRAIKKSKLTDEEKEKKLAALREEYRCCILMDYQNVKGVSSKELEERVAKLEKGEALCINTYATEGTKLSKQPWETQMLWGRLFGGILAEDYTGTSSTSWQQYQLFSPSVLESLVTDNDGEYRLNVRKKLEKLYGKKSKVMQFLFRNVENSDVAAAAAMAQRGMSQRTVEAFVFGMKQKWDTHYCDQLVMPSGWLITNNKTHSDTNGFKWLAATGQPQLYHQCVLASKVMNHGDIKAIIQHLQGTRKKLCRAQKLFLQEWRAIASDESILESLLFVKGSFGNKHEDKLVWIPKSDQDRMQRDSDGDRVLFSHRLRDVKLAKLHNEAIAGLPVPQIEVKVGKDGDEAYKAMTKGTWGDLSAGYNERLKANKYVCAPNKGQGPTGILVNMCSALLNHILWNDDNGTWAPDSTKRKATLKLYAFVCLLIQNSIDRTKKPWEVATLAQCFLLDLYSGALTSYEVEGKEGSPPLGSETWPAMAKGITYDIPTRTGYDEMYNTPVLSHWLSWAINAVNFIDQDRVLSVDKLWISDISEISQAFGGLCPKSPLETEEQYNVRVKAAWQKVAEITGSDPNELEAGWLWPEDLYAFKKEASLDVPLDKAAPGLKVVSEMVVQENRAAKAKYSLNGNTRLILFQAVEELRALESADDMSFWNVNPWGSDAQILWFFRALHGEIKRNRAVGRDLKGQSELMQGKKISDTAEYLKELKAAMNSGNFDMPAARVFERAFNTKVADKATAVQTAISLMFYATSIGFGGWSANNNIMLAWARSAYLGEYDDLYWAADMDDEAAEENTPKAILIRLLAENAAYSTEKSDEIVSWLKKLWTREVQEHQCPVTEMYRADIESRNTNPDGDWWDIIWSQWMPAMEEHLDLSRQADAMRNYFIGEKGVAKDTVQYVLDGAAGDIGDSNGLMDFIDKKMMPGFKKGYNPVVEKMCTVDLTSYPAAEAYRDWMLKQPVKDDEWANGMVGLAVSLGMCTDHRDIISMAKPIIQARRIRAWVDNAFGFLSQEEKTQMVRSALLNETTIEVPDNNAPSGIAYRTYRTLKGRPDIVVPLQYQVSLFESLLHDGLSFHALAPAPAFWFNFTPEGNLREGNPFGRKFSQKWVYYDARMRNGVEYDVTSIKEEFEHGMAVGDMYSMAEMRTWKGLMQQDLANQEVLQANPGMENKIKGMLHIVNNKLKEGETQYVRFKAKQEFVDSLVFAEKLKLMNIYDEQCIPMHWGGNNKARVVNSSRYTISCRTSAHRSIWRFIFSTLGDGEFSPEKMELYNHLAGCDLWTGRGEKKKDPGMDQQKALKGGWMNNSNTANFYNNEKKKKGPRPFLPFSTPGVSKKVIAGQTTWCKVPRSPQNEYWGSIVLNNNGNMERAYLCDDDAEVKVAPNAPFLKSLIKAKPHLTSWAVMRNYSLEAYRNHNILRINGINSAPHVANKLFLLRGDQFDSFSKAELLLGLRHITAAWDSYVLRKWDTRTRLRFISKGTSSWKAFFKQMDGQNITFDIILPKDAEAKLRNDLFCDPKNYYA